MSLDDKYRKRVKAEIEKRQLTSVMNNTKWIELKNAISKELSFPPPYLRKDVLDKEHNEFSEDVTWWGDYEEGLLPYISIEWIEIRPRYIKSQGRDMIANLENIEAQFVSVLKKYNIPYKNNNGSYFIYGYASDFSEIKNTG